MKFVKQTLREMAECQKKGVKRIRTENGILMNKSSKVPQVYICIYVIINYFIIYR